MPRGLDTLEHIVVLMMENRSFDHMLGSLKADDPRIDGLTGNEFNIDTTGQQVFAEPLAKFQGQLNPDPDHHFAAVDRQIFNGDTSAHRVPTMQGFVRSYYDQQRNVKQSRKIMYTFPKDKLPVLTTLAREFAVFNGWFASIPGPTLCNRAFAHYGTSFGHVGMEVWYANQVFKSIYERMLDEGRTAKIYYFDQPSSTLEVVNLLRSFAARRHPGVPARAAAALRGAVCRGRAQRGLRNDGAGAGVAGGAGPRPGGAPAAAAAGPRAPHLPG